MFYDKMLKNIKGKNMKIKNAEIYQLDEILNVYKIAREFMKNSGNPTQWGDNYPPAEMIAEDIKNGKLFVGIDENDKIHFVFFFSLGEDPTYNYIENGCWLNSDSYGTIHKVASDGVTKGVFFECFKFCRNIIGNLKIDTHQNNKKMQHTVEKCGFKKCGTIYLQNGDSRIAYQFAE